MIQIKNDIVSINRKIKITRKHKAKMKHLNSRQFGAYLLSILGSKQNLNGINDLIKTKGRDALARKSPNNILVSFQDLLDNDGNRNHAPRNSSDKTNWVGVEIECYIDGINFRESERRVDCGDCDGSGRDYDDDGEPSGDCPQCEGAGYVYCDGDDSNVLMKLKQALEREKITRCSVRRDGSLDDDGGVEITFLFDAAHGFAKLEKLCNILNSFGARVNSDCGLHIHLDFSHSIWNSTNVMTMGKRMALFLPILSQFVPVSRRTNNYCKLVASSQDRYSAINLTSYSKHRTIEIRMHSGTTNFNKIKNWIELWTKIKNKCSNPLNHEPEDFQDFIDILELNDTLVEFYDKRMTKFNTANNKPLLIENIDGTMIELDNHVQIEDNEERGNDAA